MKKSKWLALEDRKRIEAMYNSGKSVQEIADEMRRNRAGIYRELRRGETGEMDANGRAAYSAELAQKNTYETRQRWRGVSTVAE